MRIRRAALFLMRKEARKTRARKLTPHELGLRLSFMLATPPCQPMWFAKSGNY